MWYFWVVSFSLFFLSLLFSFDRFDAIIGLKHVHIHYINPVSQSVSHLKMKASSLFSFRFSNSNYLLLFSSVKMRWRKNNEIVLLYSLSSSSTSLLLLFLSMSKSNTSKSAMCLLRSRSERDGEKSISLRKKGKKPHTLPMTVMPEFHGRMMELEERKYSQADEKEKG